MPGPAFSLWRAITLALLSVWALSLGSALAADPPDAVAWYDTLGLPDAKNLPYVRVSTGGWKQSQNAAPESDFVEGFLVREDANSFAVFLCSVSHFKDRIDLSDQ